MPQVRHLFPLIVVLSAFTGACGPKKRSVSPKLPAASKPANPESPSATGGRVTFALSRPLSRDQAVRAFDTSVMKLMSVDSQADGPNWKTLLSDDTGLDLRNICRQRGTVSVLVDKSSEEQLESTAQGIIFSLSGPEDERGCDQNKEYCTLSLVAGEGGRFHLRVAELTLQEGPFLEEVVSEQILGKETWAAVLTFTPQQNCQDRDEPQDEGRESPPTPVITMTQVVFSHRGVMKVVHEGIHSVVDPEGEANMESRIRVHRVQGKTPDRGFNLLTVVELRNPGNAEETTCGKIDEDGNLTQLSDGDKAALKANPEFEAYDCTNAISR